MEINKINYTKLQFTEAKFKRFEFSIFNKKGFIQKLTFLSGLTPILIQKIFGDSNFKIKGEFNNHIWIVEFKNQQFAIISAAGRGTTLETIAEDKEIMCKFVDELISLFLNLSDPKIELLKTYLR